VAIALSVPSIEAALEGMEEQQSFKLKIGSKTVVQVEWRDGLEVESKLQQCLKSG